MLYKFALNYFRLRLMQHVVQRVLKNKTLGKNKALLSFLEVGLSYFLAHKKKRK